MPKGYKLLILLNYSRKVVEKVTGASNVTTFCEENVYII